MRKKTYRQNCSLAFSSDLLGERWTLLIFRELLIQPCRFGELNQYLQGMGSNLLSARLKELEAEGLIEKQVSDNKRGPYQLSDPGREIEPIVLAMIRWGFHHGEAEPGYLHYHHWDLLAMKALFQPERCEQELLMQFDSPELCAWVSASPTGFDFCPSRCENADRVIESTIQGFQMAIQQGEYADDEQILSLISCFDLSISGFQASHFN